MVYSDLAAWQIAGFPEDDAFAYWRHVLNGRAIRRANQLGHRDRLGRRT